MDLDTLDMDFNTMDSPAMMDSETTPANAVGSTTTNPIAAEPTATDPSIVNSTTTGPGIVDPTATSPGIVDSTATGPRIVDPLATGLNIVNPTMTDPSPATTNINVASPAVADPGVSATIPQPTPSSIAVTVDTPLSIRRDSCGQDTPDPVKSPVEIVYPKFITPEILEHLSSITNVDGWSNLVQAYLEFEAASPSKSVSFLYSLSCFANSNPYLTEHAPSSEGASLRG